jgi:hypothetical protein
MMVTGGESVDEGRWHRYLSYLYLAAAIGLTLKNWPELSHEARWILLTGLAAVLHHVVYHRYAERKKPQTRHSEEKK